MQRATRIVRNAIFLLLDRLGVFGRARETRKDSDLALAQHFQAHSHIFKSGTSANLGEGRFSCGFMRGYSGVAM